MSSTAPAIVIIIITIIFPPAGVFAISECSSDLFINIILTILGYFPGHIHAFYLEYVFFDRRDQGRMGQLSSSQAPFVYSENIQTGGTRGYGTV